ncbi:hypothetical protein ACISK3_18150 [Morganella morganii]
MTAIVFPHVYCNDGIITDLSGYGCIPENLGLPELLKLKRDKTDNVFSELVYQPTVSDSVWFYRAETGEIGLAVTRGSKVVYLNLGIESTGTAATIENITNALTGYAKKDDLFGTGQRWVDVTALRQRGVVYTNTTSKPIFIAISHISSNKANGEYVGFGFDVDGKMVYGATATNNQWMEALSVPVQPGGKYVFNADPSQINYKSWMEFRG